VLIPGDRLFVSPEFLKVGLTWTTTRLC
jgi:hypothetical protein